MALRLEYAKYGPWEGIWVGTGYSPSQPTQLPHYPGYTLPSVHPSPVPMSLLQWCPKQPWGSDPSNNSL